jgi:hypothetical protein
MDPMDITINDEVNFLVVMWSQISHSSQSFPYLMRFKQCIVEFLSSPYRSDKRAFMNAIKYATAFPVIFLSFAQRQIQDEGGAERSLEKGRVQDYQLFQIW